MARSKPTTAVVLAAATAGALAGERRRRRRERRRYRLRSDKPVAVELRRVASAQIELANDALGHSDGLHDARKALKRARALLKLARPEVYRRESRALRDVGRALSPARDDAVARAALAELERQAGADGFALLPKAPPRPPGEHVRAELAAAAVRVETWPLEDCDLERGLRRIYRDGRKAQRAAAKSPDDDHLHELRKRAKDLRHATELLRETGLRRARKRARELGDLLGDDHDLAILRERAAPDPLLIALIERRRHELQAAALPLAAKLYSRSPRRFTKPLR